MKLFDTVMAACARRFGGEQVQQIAEHQLEIVILNEEGQPMFPVYVGFHNDHDMEFTAILFAVPEEDAQAFMAQCNNLNTQYPAVKWYMEDLYLCAAMDLLLYTGEADDVMSMLAALLQVVAANLPGLLG